MSRPMHLALLGDPVAHSRSPAIHRAALKEAGLEGDYQAIRADVEVLQRVVDDLRSGLFDGLNITMPLKSAAASLADRSTPIAQTAGSVNTLRARKGLVEAESTDAVAFRQIFGNGRFPDGAHVLVLGSGGSAQAALAALDNSQVYVSARSTERAEDLADRFAASGVVTWGATVDGAILVNATPLGMRGEELPGGLLRVSRGLVDLPYGSAETPAILAARAGGIPYVDGIEFLARQAAASFEWWTGRVIDLVVLVRAARKA